MGPSYHVINNIQVICDKCISGLYQIYIKLPVINVFQDCIMLHVIMIITSYLWYMHIGTVSGRLHLTHCRDILVLPLSHPLKGKTMKSIIKSIEHFLFTGIAYIICYAFLSESKPINMSLSLFSWQLSILLNTHLHPRNMSDSPSF